MKSFDYKIKLLQGIFFLLLSFFVYAEESEEVYDNEILAESVIDLSINPRTGFPEITEKPFVMFNEGVTASLVTRVQSQKDFNRSNFVWQDYLVGLYCEMQTVNMKPLNSIVRVAGFYPVAHTFNGMKQKSQTVILYGFDIYYGVLFQTDMWKYVRLNFALGPHFDYLLSDEYHHVELGAGALLGCELPVHKYFTVLTNILATYDYGNFGSNRVICPYTGVWQYQAEVGLRFSKRGKNTYSYIPQK